MVVSRAPPFKLYRTRILLIPPSLEGTALLQRLRAVPGVLEAVLVAEEGVAYLKIDEDELDEKLLQCAMISSP